MHPSAKTLLVVAILLVASVSIAQEAAPSADAALMARLYYDNSGPAQLWGMTHVCFVVSKDGDYRIVRSSRDGHTQRLRGNVPKEEFDQLSNLLGAADFRNLSGSRWPGVIRQEAETFAAEIAVDVQDDGHSTKRLEPESWRRQWLNPDGETPFPSPVAKVVDWLRRFEPKNAKSFERTELPDVCPSARPWLVQPSISESLRP